MERLDRPKEYAQQRKRYFDGELTHQQFYMWIAECVGLPALRTVVRGVLTPQTKKTGADWRTREAQAQFNARVAEEINPNLDWRERLRIALLTDEHLNNIPLRLWDVRDEVVRQLAQMAGFRGWALMDTVCVLKAVARSMAEKTEAEEEQD